MFDWKKILVSNSTDEVILPIYFPPPIRCHLPYSIISSIIVADMQNWNWIDNNFIQIWKENKDDERIHFYPSQDFTYRDHSLLTMTDLNSNILPLNSKTIIDYIINAINNGYYIVLYLDEFYIPQTRLYSTRHKNHSQFIFGYNYKRKIFKLLNFDKKTNNLNIIDLNFSDVIYSFKIYIGEIPNLNLETNKDTDYRMILMKPLYNSLNKEMYQFPVDVSTINQQLEDFLESANSSKKTNFFTGRLNGSWGLSVYKELADNILFSNDGIDFRGFYLIYEHKIFMRHRFYKLFQLGFAENYDQELQEVVLIAEKMKMLCYKYNICMASEQLKSIVNLFSLLEEKEKRLYTEYLNDFYRHS